MEACSEPATKRKSKNILTSLSFAINVVVTHVRTLNCAVAKLSFEEKDNTNILLYDTSYLRSKNHDERFFHNTAPNLKRALLLALLWAKSYCTSPRSLSTEETVQRRQQGV